MSDDKPTFYVIDGQKQELAKFPARDKAQKHADENKIAGAVIDERLEVHPPEWYVEPTPAA